MKSPLQILIVDDALTMRMVLKKQLTNLGFEVVGEAEDGREAIKKYAELTPDAVMLDLVMPKFDGKKTLQKLMEIDENAKVIICSSLGAEEDVEFCLRAGAHSYIQKPYDAEGIKIALDSLS